MELTTAFDAKHFIDDAMASGKMSEEVHKTLSSYLQKKMDCEINKWCEDRFLCPGEDDVSEQTTHVAAHYIATSYFKIPPGLKDPFVKYDHLHGDGAVMIQPTINAVQYLSEENDLKWPLKLKFLEGDEVPEDVLDKEKATGKAKKLKSKASAK